MQHIYPHLRCGLRVRARAVLEETFDVVYTGVGALNWLPDMRRWAEIVRGFLRPGGVLYLREGHPMLATLDNHRDDQLLVVCHPYFPTGDPLRWEEPRTYTDGGEGLPHTVTYEWPHPISEVLTALLDAGLAITAFEEHDFLEWAFFDWLQRDASGRYVLPEGRERLPLMYSLSAVAAG